MKYSFPEGFKFRNLFIFNPEKTKQAICYAAEYMDENPELNPKFELVFNVLLNSDDATKDMTQHVYKACDVEQNKTPEPMLDEVDFTTYAIAVATIKQEGFDGYIKGLLEISETA